MSGIAGDIGRHDRQFQDETAARPGMADSNERRLAYRLSAIAQIGVPILVLFFAVGVALLAVGMFLPLVTLIESLA